MAVNRVTIRGVTGFTPLSGDWAEIEQGGSTVYLVVGSATAQLHLANGDLVEVEVEDGNVAEITITGTDAVVRFP